MKTEFNTLTDFYAYILEDVEDIGWQLFFRDVQKKPPELFPFWRFKLSENIFVLRPDIHSQRTRLKELEGKVVTINNQSYLVSMNNREAFHRALFQLL